MEAIKFSRSREKFLFLLLIFLSRARLSSMPAAMYVTFCSSGKTEQNSVRAGGHCLRLASGRTTRSLEKLNSAWWANGHWMDWPDTSLCLGSGERLIIADESCLWNKSPVGHFPLSAVCFKLTGKLVDAQQTVHILKTLGRFTKGMDWWNALCGYQHN